METELSFIIINPETPEKVKRNIFKRINTGGMPLSNQEIRHALYQGRASELLKLLVENKIYANVIGNTVNDDRMAGRELILRFLSFYLFGYKSYSGDMDDFLSLCMKSINENNIIPSALKKVIPSNSEITQAFEKGLSRADMLFGEHAFRKSLPGDQRKTPINKSLFELWLYILTRMKDDTFSILHSRKKVFISEYANLFKNDDFMNSISRHGASIQGAKMRRRKLIGLIRGIKNV